MDWHFLIGVTEEKKCIKQNDKNTKRNTKKLTANFQLIHSDVIYSQNENTGAFTYFSFIYISNGINKKNYFC